MDIKNNEIISDVFTWINNLLINEKRQQLKYGDQIFYPSEIHFLSHVVHEENKNITKIAEHLGVTKGAVSKVISRLVKKGALLKNKDPYKKNEMTLELTQFGTEVFSHYLRTLTKLQKKYDDYLNSVDEDDKKAIQAFIRAATGFTSDILKK